VPEPAPIEISAVEARRVALAAQGFGRRRPSRVDARHIRRTLDDVGLLQLDSVNVFCRSHYMPVFSRLGPYPRRTLDRLCGHEEQGGRATVVSQPREFFEYWGHEASVVPVELQPLLRWRMARADTLAWRPVAKIAAEQPELLERVLEMVRDQGPIRASEIGATRAAWGPGQMWNWNEGKTAVEYLFCSGQVTAARRVNFERLYDLPERVLPAKVLAAPTPSEADAQRHLILHAARRLGVGTEPDLGDYFRLPRRDSKARVRELVASRDLVRTGVEGWAADAYVLPTLTAPTSGGARALLSPFDSLIWSRERTERLFDFRYRVEIYTPAAKRVHGYYVLPFLLDDRLVARVDLKTDRAAGVLRVLGAFVESAADGGHVAAELADELRHLATWLGLHDVTVAPRGELAGQLTRAIRLTK
jgi:uncharacterized protein